MSYKTCNFTFYIFPFSANFVTLFANLEFRNGNTTKAPEVLVVADFFMTFEIYIHKMNFVYF